MTRWSRWGFAGSRSISRPTSDILGHHRPWRCPIFHSFSLTLPSLSVIEQSSPYRGHVHVIVVPILTFPSSNSVFLRVPAAGIDDILGFGLDKKACIAVGHFWSGNFGRVMLGQPLAITPKRVV